MKLISMTDFVLEQLKWPYTKTKKIKIIRNYANFLKQPLNLGMFVPCVDNEVFNYSKHGNENEYQQAKERVLFEDVKVIRNSHNFFIIEPTKGTIFYRILKNNTTVTIEDLFKLRTDITLTKSAQKQLGL